MIRVLRRVLPLLAVIVAISALAGAGAPAQAAKAARCDQAWDCHAVHLHALQQRLVRVRALDLRSPPLRRRDLSEKIASARQSI
jgi:hypothetical protein